MGVGPSKLSGQHANAMLPAWMAGWRTRSLPRMELLGFAAVAAVFLLLVLFVAFQRNINWDEFHFLAQVYTYDRGALTEPFQTFHVHLFRWLVWLPLDEPSQIVAGRLVMVLLQLGTCMAIAAISLRFFELRTTLLVVATFMAAGFVVEHGASFRTDPVLSFSLMASLAIMFASRLGPVQLAAAGLLAALALIVSIKAALYLPPFFAALVWRIRQDGWRFAIGRFAGAALVVAAALAALWAFHAGSLDAPEALSKSTGHADAALEKTVLSQGLFPRARYILAWLLSGLIAKLAIVAGIAMALVAAFGKDRGLVPAILLLAAPVLCLVFYRNAYSYFFPFLLPPVVIASGFACRRMARPEIATAMHVVLLASLVLAIPRYAYKDQQAQRETIAAVKAAFPQPTPYVDRSAMIPSYPKVGFFMTSWGLEAARASGTDVMTGIVRNRQPRFVVANSGALSYALDPAGETAPVLRLSGRDEQTLRENFVHHWGAIWVAGKRLTASSEPRVFELLIPGVYTLECAGGPVIIDGSERKCGTILSLEKGEHTIFASRPAEVILRTGAELVSPGRPPSKKPIFYPL